MVIGGAQPYCHLGVGVEIVIDEAEEAGFVVEGAGDAFDEGREVEGDDIEANADGGEILLDHGGHALAILVAGVGNDGELDGVAAAIAQGSILQLESVLGEFTHGGRGVEGMGREFLVEPELVGWRDETDRGLGMTFEDHAHQVVSVDGRGDRAAEAGGCEPGLLVIGEGGGGNLVEPHLFGIERDAGIEDGLGGFFFKRFERLGIDGVDEIDLSAGEAKHFDIAILLDVEPD